MKKIVGITGGIGSGKSLVSEMFQELGATIVDADRIAREILEPGGRAFKKVVDSFGKEVLNNDGTLDRKKIADIVFSNPDQLELLNSLTHPVVFEVMQEEVERANDGVICLDVPLLFTCDFPIFCHKTIAVLAPKEIRIHRILKRDQCSVASAEARIANQLSDQEFQEKADICINNDGDVDNLRKHVLEIYHQILER